MNHTHIPHIYRPEFGLLVDLYHLTMAYGFWKRGLYRRRAIFTLFYRKNPFGHPYTLASGLQLAIDVLERFRFTADDIQFLGNLRGADGTPLFDVAFLNYLQRMRFSCHIDAMPEGTAAFPFEPLLRVEGPLIEAQLIESALLNLVNFSTLITTKAARIVQAAGDDPVIEFGLRRAQGIDGALTASRAAYIGGCQATSNVLAARYYGIPVKGTHAHSWVMVFDDELTAFREYARAMPNNCIFLVDTFDTVEGVKNAIAVAREMQREGHRMVGIRLDSGDLAALSIEARRLLDEAGFPEAAIVASDQIDEYRIHQMKEQGSRVNVWGVGTRLVTAFDEPALGGVYKLSAITAENGTWESRLKLSEEQIKISIPGQQQVKRFYDASGRPCADMIYDLNLPAGRQMISFAGDQSWDQDECEGEDLLVPVFRDGRRVYESPPVGAIRDHALRQQSLFRAPAGRPYPVGLEAHLHQRKMELIKQTEDELTSRS